MRPLALCTRDPVVYSAETPVSEESGRALAA